MYHTWYVWLFRNRTLMNSSIISQFVELCRIPSAHLKRINTSFSEENQLILDCLSDLTISWLIRNRALIILAMQELLLSSIVVKSNNIVYWQTSLECPVEPRKMTQSTRLSEAEIDNLDLSQPSQILHVLYELEHPVYIVDMEEEKGLFYNPVVQTVLSNASDERIRSCPLALNYPDELKHRNDLIKKDKNIPDYEYKALRWVKDGSLWRRREMEFVSNFAFGEYLGKPARISILKRAMPLSKVI